jgi:6-phosphogluconolactonase
LIPPEPQRVSREVRILEDAAAISRAAAGEFLQAAQEAVRAGGRFSVALAGGSTPRALYTLLVGDPALRAAVPWDKTFFFFGDERHVPPDDPESNFRMASEAMFSNLALSPRQVVRIKGENPDAAQAALDYEQALRGFFRLAEGQFPRFDLVLLGMGPDGHTASLFPGTAALHEGWRLAVSNRVAKFNSDRVTLTAPVLNNAARILFMAHGDDKAPALRAVLEGPYEPELFPAQLIQPKNGTLLWLVDKTAARLLAKAAS